MISGDGQGWGLHSASLCLCGLHPALGSLQQWAPEHPKYVPGEASDLSGGCCGQKGEH